MRSKSFLLCMLLMLLSVSFLSTSVSSFAAVSDAVFDSVTGAVELSSDSAAKEWDRCLPGMTIPAGSYIRTLGNSSCVIHISDQVSYVLREDTEIFANALSEQSTSLWLSNGKLWVKTSQVPSEGTVKIECSQADAAIFATNYVLEDDGVSSLVKVIEGKVTYTSNVTGEAISVASGQMVTATASGMGAVVQYDVEAETDLWQLYLYGEAEPDRDTGMPLILLILAGGALLFLIIIILLIAIAVKSHKKKKRISQSSQQGFGKTKSKYCSRCGNPIPLESVFCSKCGNKIQ